MGKGKYTMTKKTEVEIVGHLFWCGVMSAERRLKEMISKEVMNRVLKVLVSYEQGKTDNSRHIMKTINVYELAFDKCIDWLWDQGYEVSMIRANNIFHVRLWGNGVEDKRFYSNPHDKYDAVMQACEWVIERIENGK